MLPEVALNEPELHSDVSGKISGRRNNARLDLNLRLELWGWRDQIRETLTDDVQLSRLLVGVIAPPGRGSITATQPLAVLRGSGPDLALVEALIQRCSVPEV